ncbi:MAG: hypothetical protein Q9193_002919, partial [Seirophora villosa]
MPALIHDTRSQISASRNPRSSRRRGRRHRHRSARSATRSCQQKEDGGKMQAPPIQRHVRFEAPPQPVELDSTPAPRRMEEARVRVLRGPAVSFFSDDSSDVDVGGGEEDL